MNKILLIIIFLILAYILFYCLNNEINKENFTTINPGIFPNSDNVGILSNFYKWADPKSVSSFNYSRQAPAYPVFPAKSCNNNNLEFWPTPPNGTCAFPELCNNFYDVLDCKVQEKNHSDKVTIWPPCKNPRVNFWCSN